MLVGILNININQSVKRVQRRATKLLMETRHMTYSKWLNIYICLPYGIEDLEVT